MGCPENPVTGRLLDETNRILESENPTLRPRDYRDRPGGLLLLPEDRSLLILADLHGRVSYLKAAMGYRPEGKATVTELLDRDEIVVVCVGDGVHTEVVTSDRWKAAFAEYQYDYENASSMNQEMEESFSAMAEVMRMKGRWPEGFHFLKGNHENIKNESFGGNHPFGKYALEGEMVLAYVRQFWGEDFLEEYSHFEKNLPLIAVYPGAVVSHAEPGRAFSRRELIEGHATPGLVHHLTWTANDQAESGSVRRMLRELIGEGYRRQGIRYWGGHRIVHERYRLRAGGDFIQFHNPAHFPTVYLPRGEFPAPEEAIRYIDETMEA